MSALISEKSKMLIRILLTDEKIQSKVFENISDKEKYKICTIESSGAVILGKTPFRWWNKLLNCQDKLTFESFALKVWDALVDASSGLNNKAIMNGLSQEIVMNSVRDRKYDWVVQRLYECWSHVAQNSAGYQAPPSPEGDTVINQGAEKVLHVRQDGPRNIVINVNNQKKIIPFIDSIGDDLNIGLEFGITGIRKLC